MTRIKICGITRITQALAASAAGAHYTGLVFAPSRRRISPEMAREIVDSLHKLASTLITVGVFVNYPSIEVNRIAEKCRLDWVQLSGDEGWEYCREIRRPVIKAVHISSTSTAKDIMEHIERGYSIMSQESLICLLDTHVQGVYGGTGQAFNWRLAEEVSQRVPIIVAGGLNPDNVGQMIQQVKPWGVDVSSGVETGGRKDMHKIKEFVEKVRSRE